MTEKLKPMIRLTMTSKNKTTTVAHASTAKLFSLSIMYYEPHFDVVSVECQTS